MKYATRDPRRSLPVAAAEGKYINHSDRRLYDPETGRPLHGMLIDNRYELVREIGRGGSCICYHAFDRKTGEFAAIKEWFPLSFAQEGWIERQGNTLALTAAGKAFETTIRHRFETDFVREETLAGRQRYTEDSVQLNNDPNAFSVELLRTGTWMQYLVIETEAGTPLDRVQFGGTTPEERLADILDTGLQLATRLEWLHSEKRVLHCDLKPENIYVSQLNTGKKDEVSSHILRLIDYGSGFALDTDDHVQQESMTHLSFSAGYAAPELQALRDEERWEDAAEKLGPATDVYAALRIILELLAPEANKEELYSGDLWDSSILGHLPEPVIEYYCNFFENALSTERLKNATELKSALEKLKELAQCCISGEWLRIRSEACAGNAKAPDRLFPIAFWRTYGEQQRLTAFAATLPRNLILTGNAGAGKSTVMDLLAIRLLQLLKQEDRCCALQVPLKKFDGSPHFIKDWILYQILELKTVGKNDEQNRQRLMELFAEGTLSYYLLLDGLDELPHPGAIYGEVESLSQCAGVRLVVSSRYVPKNTLFEERFEHAKICPLSKAAIREILDEAGLPGGDDERVLSMLTVPLWLNLYLGLPRDGKAVPKTSAELMNRHVEYLLQKAERNALVLRREALLPLMQETLETLFPRFCLHMEQRRQLSFDARQAKQMLVQSVEELDTADAFDPMRRDAVPEANYLTARVVRDVLIPFGLLEERNGSYSFAHALFRDYFATREILRQLQGRNLPESLSGGPLTETVAAFLAEMEQDVDPERLMDIHCRGRRGAEYAMAVRNLVEILKQRHKDHLSGRNLSDIDLTITDLVGVDLSGNGEAAANLRGSFLSDHTFDPVFFDHICGDPPFPIPSVRQILMEVGKRTVFLDMDTLCVVKSIPTLFAEVYLWNGSVWGVAKNGLELWEIILNSGETTCIPLERPAENDWWSPRLLLDGKLYLSGYISSGKCLFDLKTRTVTLLKVFPPEAEKTAYAVVRSCSSEGWHMAGTGALLYRTQESDLYLMDAITKEELCLKNLPRDILSFARTIYRDGENVSILTFRGDLFLVKGERQERITLNRMPLVQGVHVTADECLEIVSTRTRSRWALESGTLCRKDSGLARKIDATIYSGHTWQCGIPVVKETSAGILEVKGLSEPGMAVLTYSPVGNRKTELLLNDVNAVFPLENGAVAIKRRREVCVEVYGPSSEDATQLAGRFMHPTGEIYSPDAVVWWNDGLALYHHDSECEGFAGGDNKSRIYYVTEHTCRWVPFADLLVDGCDLTSCEGLSDETKELLKTYGAKV